MMMPALCLSLFADACRRRVSCADALQFLYAGAYVLRVARLLRLRATSSGKRGVSCHAVLITLVCGRVRCVILRRHLSDVALQLLSRPRVPRSHAARRFAAPFLLWEGHFSRVRPVVGPPSYWLSGCLVGASVPCERLNRSLPQEIPPSSQCLLWEGRRTGKVGVSFHVRETEEGWEG